MPRKYSTRLLLFKFLKTFQVQIKMTQKNHLYLDKNKCPKSFFQFIYETFVGPTESLTFAELLKGKVQQAPII